MSDERTIWTDFAARPGMVARYPIHKPWVANGYKYASNGWICVRQKCDEPATEGTWPDAASLFNRPRATWSETPLTIPDIKPKTEECSWCNGKGYRTCDLDHEHECGNCNDTGMITTWEVLDFAPGFALAGKYAAIAFHYGFTVYPPVSPDKSTPLYGSRPDGTEAVFMPLSVEEK